MTRMFTDALRPAVGLLLTAALLLGAPAQASGEPAQDFSLRDLSGQKVSLQDYRGKVVLLDFWATWCGPCKDALPHWQRMYDDLKGQGFVVLAISTDDARTRPQVRPYVRRKGFTFPVATDPDSSSLVLYNPTKTVPYSVLIDRDFQVDTIHTGYAPGDEVEIRERVEELLGETPDEAPSE